MRPAAVLVILALALLGTIYFGEGGEQTFDERFSEAERRIQDLSADIEGDLNRPEDLPE